ncbi:MAG TPA: MBL fold metallo-hydrolase [Gammaproteobacteria bacterium]
MADDKNKKLAIDKVNGELSVIVLGSGGPMPASSGRASAGYLILTDGKPRLLMDLGGGSYQRIGESGATIQNIDAILLTHLHIDHMADLSAAIKGIYFHAREHDEPRLADRPIRIFGPNVNAANQFPASATYVETLYDASVGLERYLHTFSRAISGGEFAYEVTNLSPNPGGAITTIIDDADGLVVKSVGVFHGPVPSVAFRIEYRGHSIVYTGDTNSRMPPATLNPDATNPLSQQLIELAAGADLLIYDTAITDTEPGKVAPAPGFLGDRLFFNLHTTPATMGQIASQANAKTLVLSHITPITEAAIDEIKDVVRAQNFSGRIKVARDLKVYNLGGDDD